MEAHIDPKTKFKVDLYYVTPDGKEHGWGKFPAELIKFAESRGFTCKAEIKVKAYGSTINTPIGGIESWGTVSRVISVTFKTEAEVTKLFNNIKQYVRPWYERMLRTPSNKEYKRINSLLFTI